MKKVLLLLSLLLVCSYGFSQSYQWGKNAGGVGASVTARSTVMDAAGYIYTVGYFSGTVDLDPSASVLMVTSAGGDDIFVQKFSPAGNLVRGFAIGGSSNDRAHSIAVSSTYQVIITGGHQGGGDFDPGAGTTTLSSAGDYDVFVARYDSAGALVFANSMGGTGIDIGYDVDMDVLGNNVMVTGDFSLSGDFNPGAGTTTLTSAGGSDGFVTRFDGTGGFLYAYSYGGTGDEHFRSIAFDPSLNVLVTGSFEGTADFDPSAALGNMISNGGSDIFIMRFYIVAGSTPGYVSFGGTGYDDSYAVESDASGNIYVTGKFLGSPDFEPFSGTTVLSSLGSEDAFVASYTPAWGLNWARAFGSASGNEQGLGLALDNTANVYTTGVFSGDTDFDPGAGTATITVAGNYDIFMQKLDASGAYVSAIAIQSTDEDQGLSITANSSGEVAFCGFISGACDFNPGPLDDFHSMHGTRDMFVTKFGACTPTSETINASTCDTFLLNGTPYTSNGTFVQTLTNMAGCDSVITLNLTISDSYTTISTSACFSYELNGMTYTSSGTFVQELVNAVGCDSVITLNLVINTVETGVTLTGDTLTVDILISDISGIQWMDCATGLPVPGAADPSFVPATAGSYAAVITTTDGCTDTTLCYTTTDRSDPDRAAAFTLWPNPTNGSITVSSPLVFHETLLELSDLCGRVIRRQVVTGVSNVQMELDETPGVYLLTIIRGDERCTFKVVKE